VFAINKLKPAKHSTSEGSISMGMSSSLSSALHEV